MKTSTLQFLSLRLTHAVLLMLCSISIVRAQESATRWLGVFGVQIPGSSPEYPLRRTYLSTCLTSLPVYGETVHAVSGKTIQSSTSGLPPQSSPPLEKYYLHFRSNDEPGYIAEVSSFGDGEIHCEVDLPSFIEVDDYFIIYRHLRLSEVFTPDNSYGFGAGTSADQADNIAVFNPELQDVELFYFNSTRSRWEKEGVAESANDHPLRFPYSYYVIRRSPGMIRIVIQGIVPEDPVMLPVQSGLNLFSLPIDNTPSVGHLVSTTGSYPARSGPNATNSDLFTIHEASSPDARGPYYYSTAPGGPKWLTVGNSLDASSSVPRDPFSSLKIQRKGVPGFVRLTPNFYTNPPYFSLSPNAQPGETTTTALVNFGPRVPPFPPGITFSLYQTTDFRNLIELDDSLWIDGDTLSVLVQVPAGQSRIFYRLSASAF